MTQSTRDALADAETLCLVASEMREFYVALALANEPDAIDAYNAAALCEWWLRDTVSDAMPGDPVSTAYRARAAFRAVPGLRGEP